MKIRSFGCSRFKAFKEPVSIELRPLTLFLGRNNSGKSALLRLLPLLLRACSSQASSGLPLRVGRVGLGDRFQDLIYGQFPNGNVEFSLNCELDGQELDFSATIQHILSVQRQATPIISRFSMRNPVPLEWNWDMNSPRTLYRSFKRPGDVASHAVAVQVINLATYNDVGEVSFRGLLPNPQLSDFDRLHGNTWNEIRQAVSEFEQRMVHFSPVRDGFESFYPVEDGDAEFLAFDGNGIANRLFRNTELLHKVDEWFRENMDGWHLSRNSSAEVVSFIMKRGSASANISQSGQGMQQVLPLVVQQLARQLEPPSPFLDLIEEPESHLHAAAHAALGDLFLETARIGSGQVVVETHSENLLLRIRRRIAEGKVDPELVALYWIDDHPEEDQGSTVQRIPIKKDGSVESWPEGIFSEGYQEVRAMHQAATKKAQPAQGVA